MIPRCPRHGSLMVEEDHDAAYNQTTYVCREYAAGCREVAYTGPSDSDIYRREHVG